MVLLRAAGCSTLLRIAVQNRTPLKIPVRYARYDEILQYLDWDDNAIPPEELILSAGAFQKDKGKIYDKKPFKYRIEEGKKYAWCSCGYSRQQPFCDGMHKKPWINVPLRPVKFVAKETKDVWFCMCKQTNSKPYCDKSCDAPIIQQFKGIVWVLFLPALFMFALCFTMFLTWKSWSASRMYKQTTNYKLYSSQMLKQRVKTDFKNFKDKIWTDLQF